MEKGPEGEAIKVYTGLVDRLDGKIPERVINTEERDAPIILDKPIRDSNGKTILRLTGIDSGKTIAKDDKCNDGIADGAAELCEMDKAVNTANE
jgi:hypothetical protein